MAKIIKCPVARMEAAGRNPGTEVDQRTAPDSASLHPGYGLASPFLAAVAARRES